MCRSSTTTILDQNQSPQFVSTGEAFSKMRLLPRMLVDVSKTDPSVELLGMHLHFTFKFQCCYDVKYSPGLIIIAINPASAI